MARHTLETADGRRHSDPSEDALLLFLDDLLRADDGFLILSDDAAKNRYIQVLRQPGGFVVEQRDGGRRSHVGTEIPDDPREDRAAVRTAHRLLFGWMLGTAGWDAGATWTRVR